MFVDSHAGRFRKLLIGAGIAGTLVVLVRTGSRGAHRSCRHRFFVFWKVTPAGKVLMVLTLVVLVGPRRGAASGFNEARYSTIFSDTEATKRRSARGAGGPLL